MPCAQDSAHEQAAAKPPGTGLRRPRTSTPPRHATECPLLLLQLLRLLRVQGAALPTNLPTRQVGHQ
ncbi:hypothetical protein C9412_15570 [Stenotrophomonas sp. Nf1]|nr:hypothetical protein C9412_15570 [Stenotrophomonas sp. Nf1]PTA81969.1 hypothetical protein C9416_04775 [Stenotrophomonas sp. Nf4]